MTFDIVSVTFVHFGDFRRPSKMDNFINKYRQKDVLIITVMPNASNLYIAIVCILKTFGFICCFASG